MACYPASVLPGSRRSWAITCLLAAVAPLGLTRVVAAQGRFDWVEASTAPLAERAPEFPPPENVLELGLGGFAKVLCSAVFVSLRDAEEARRNSAFFFLPETSWDDVEARIDRRRREVRASLGEMSRTARFVGDQGCVLLPIGEDEIHFEPVAVKSSLPPAAEQDWPTGDRIEASDWPADVNRPAIRRAVAKAFGDPDAHTAAFLVVHRGRILAERYARGVTQDTQLESWSMGKSIAGTLVGVLVEQGALTLDQLAPIGVWRREGDPRGGIRIEDLMRMSSGLRFIAPRDPDYNPGLGYPDHMYVYTGGIDSAAFSISRPMQFDAGTEGRYRNSDPLSLIHIVQEIAKVRGEEPLTFPQRALFDRIGIRRQVLETDPYGTFLITGYDYGTARNWARLGMLYLQDGVWEGERILPEGWSEFVSTPAPAWEAPVYGGMVWLNRDDGMSLPEDAYYMAGAGGQRTIIVPSLDLVVVRLGHMRGNDRGMELLDEALAILTETLR